MTADNNRVVVIGGVNLDIGGRSFAPLRDRDSNPGRVRFSSGGVGRNIAHNLSLLGLNVSFLTALGGDAAAAHICSSCEKRGIDLSMSIVSRESPTSTYLYIENCDGELYTAVTDTLLCDLITPEYLKTKLSEINSADLVFADANLTAQTLAFLAENCTSPLFSDPVSTVKAERLKPILGSLHTVKPNLIEAELLSGVKITDDSSLDKAADAMLSTGLKRLFITLGDKGVYAADGNTRLRIPLSPAPVISTNGAGDAFTAALGWAYINGLSLEDSCRASSAAAAITLEVEKSVNPALSPEAICKRAGITLPNDLKQH